MAIDVFVLLSEHPILLFFVVVGLDSLTLTRTDPSSLIGVDPPPG
jgi:hypothetical protein